MALAASFDPSMATPGPASFTVVPEADLRKYLDEQVNVIQDAPKEPSQVL